MSGIRVLVGRGTEPASCGLRSVCVFCSASSAVSTRQLEAARELGELIAERHCRLVYGAGGVGLMGAVASGVAARGGRILGVIPSFLLESGAAGVPVSQEVIVTKDLFERKRYMMACADAFVALPGGYGTLDEVSDVLASASLQHETGSQVPAVKPLVLVDVEGAWAPLVEYVDVMTRSGFAGVAREQLFHVVKQPQEAMDVIDRALASFSADDETPVPNRSHDGVVVDMRSLPYPAARVVPTPAFVGNGKVYANVP